MVVIDASNPNEIKFSGIVSFVDKGDDQHCFETELRLNNFTLNLKNGSISTTRDTISYEFTNGGLTTSQSLKRTL